MIAGIGTDIVEVERIEQKVQNEQFVHQVFSPNETAYCSAQKFPAQHFAARFAAKEAFLKATGDGLLIGFNLSLVEVVLDEKGKPSILLHEEFKSIMIDRKWKHIHLSISHTAQMASAFVIIEF